jgi:hypothetical protein
MTTCTKCDWTTTKNSPDKEAQSLRMHTARKHGEMKQGTKRAYLKKSEPVQVQFCPQCGTNLFVVAQALVIARKIGAR